jgi:hypothetical protein
MARPGERYVEAAAFLLAALLCQFIGHLIHLVAIIGPVLRVFLVLPIPETAK